MIQLIWIAIFSMASCSAFATWIRPEDIKQDLSKLDRQSDITEAEFQALIKEIQTTFAPIAAGFGGKLNVSGDWKNNQPNAQATQMFGTWHVKTTGGLARHPELTKDGLSLILCHEMGHHLGGFAFATGQNPFEKPWASNEGQSDYYATHVCAKILWRDQLAKNAGFRLTTDEKIQTQCNQVWTSEEDQNLCYRILDASKSVAYTMAVLMKKPMPDFITPDTSAIDKTNHGHPMPQCRMDTSLQGALCTAYFDNRIIPGKLTSQGPASLEAEKESASFTCTNFSGFKIGLRPTCWFKPRL